MRKPAGFELCALCDSPHQITFHHLIPKTCHRNKWFRKRFTIEDMKTRGLYLCRPCHSFIHKKYPEKYLGRELNTLEKLQADEVTATYLRWAKKQRR